MVAGAINGNISREATTLFGNIFLTQRGGVAAAARCAPWLRQSAAPPMRLA